MTSLKDAENVIVSNPVDSAGDNNTGDDRLLYAQDQLW